MHAIVVVPTYWGRPQGEPPHSGDAVFDHPTPLDGESTLPRLLESLFAAQRAFPFDVLVVTGVVAADLAAQAEARVEDILERARASASRARPSPRIFHIAPRHFAPLQEAAEAAGLPRATFSPHTYPGVRNAHLAVPYALGYDVVIALDDDETVPPDYFHRVQEALTATEAGGMAGLYLDPAGSPYLMEEPARGNIFLDKARWMNATLRRLLSRGERWILTPVGFGGNMIVRRSLIERVGFDPHITRGEDIDYVLNAYMVGERFLLDTRLHIVHRPPRVYDTHPYAKLAEDVRRFLYEREKLRAAQMVDNGPARGDAARLWQFVSEWPYPGRFLADDVETHALEALHALADPGAVTRWGSPEDIVEEARERARRLAPGYLHFARAWPNLTSLLPDTQYPIANT